MKNIIITCLFAFVLGTFTSSAQKKKELLDKIATLESELNKTEQNLHVSKEKESLLNKRIEMVSSEVKDARKENADLLKTINNFSSVSEQRVQNLAISLESIKQKDEQLKVVKNELANAEEEKIKQLNIFKDGLSAIGKVSVEKGALTVAIPNASLYGEGIKIELTEQGILSINKVGELLTKNLEYNIIIEGNSNELNFAKGKSLRDNWDLSALQASTVARQLVSVSKIDPKRIETSAKSKYNTDLIETFTYIKIKDNYEAFFNIVKESMKEQ